MTKADRILSPADIETIGRTALGEGWKAELGPALGLTRERGYSLHREGADGSQAAAVIGLLAREIVRQRAIEDTRRIKYDGAEAGAIATLRTFEDRLG